MNPITDSDVERACETFCDGPLCKGRPDASADAPWRHGEKRLCTLCCSWVMSWHHEHGWPKPNIWRPLPPPPVVGAV